MEYYKKIIEDKLKELVEYSDEADFEVAERWLDGDTQNDFGKISDTRTFSDSKARQALFEAGFPFDNDLLDLLEGAGYGISILRRGAEAIDVIICEMLVPIVAQNILDRIEAAEE